MPHYQNSVIYKLKRNDDYDDLNIYVGSTTNFKNRKNCHKSFCNNEKRKEYNYTVYQYIRANGEWDNWVMIPIEQYPCNNKDELKIRERYYIDLFKSKLNKKIPCRTIKKYRDENKEFYQKYSKKYRDDNREKLKEKAKEYYEANKQTLLEYKKKYDNNNKKKIAEREKKYREANKAIISEREKEKAICDRCGCKVRKYGLKEHQKTKKCLKSQEDNVAGQL